MIYCIFSWPVGKNLKNRTVKWLAEFIGICQRNTWAMGFILLEVSLKSHSLCGGFLESPFTFSKDSYSFLPLLSRVTLYIPQHSLYLSILWRGVLFLFPIRLWAPLGRTPCHLSTHPRGLDSIWPSGSEGVHTVQLAAASVLVPWGTASCGPCCLVSADTAGRPIDSKKIHEAM